MYVHININLKRRNKQRERKKDRKRERGKEREKGLISFSMKSDEFLMRLRVNLKGPWVTLGSSGGSKG